MNRLLPLTFLALLAASCTRAAVPNAVNASGQPLDCRIEPANSPQAGDAVPLRFHLTNRTDTPLWVLGWNTPLEGWKGTIFTVTHDGAEVPYQGPMVKRGDPAQGDYVEIPAGETVSRLVDLTQVYDLSQPGKYEVTVTGSLLDVTKDADALPRLRDQHEAMELRCAGATVEVGGR